MVKKVNNANQIHLFDDDYLKYLKDESNEGEDYKQLNENYKYFIDYLGKNGHSETASDKDDDYEIEYVYDDETKKLLQKYYKALIEKSDIPKSQKVMLKVMVDKDMINEKELLEALGDTVDEVENVKEADTSDWMSKVRKDIQLRHQKTNAKNAPDVVFQDENGNYYIIDIKNDGSKVNRNSISRVDMPIGYFGTAVGGVIAGLKGLPSKLDLKNGTIDSTFGDYVKEHDVNQSKLAQAIGVDRATINNIIKKPSSVSLLNAYKIAKALGEDLETLFPFVMDNENNSSQK